MKEFLLAMSILRVLRELRDGGEGLDIIGLADGLAPQLTDFFGKGDVTDLDLDLIKTAIADALSLFQIKA